MRKLILEFSAAIALTLAAIIASAPGVSASDVMVIEAFARASATPMAKSGAAYVTIVNHGAATDRLRSLSTPAAASAEVHRSRMDGDVVKMEPAGAIEIPAGGAIAMAPGGLHIMLMGLKAPLKEGGTLDLTLVFDKAGEVAVKVPVGPVTAEAHDHGSGG